MRPPGLRLNTPVLLTRPACLPACLLTLPALPAHTACLLTLPACLPAHTACLLTRPACLPSLLLTLPACSHCPPACLQGVAKREHMGFPEPSPEVQSLAWERVFKLFEDNLKSK